MLKKSITYVDYNGVERTEDFYFNLSKSELIEWETSYEGGLSQKLKDIVAAKSAPDIMKFFKEIITKSYGEKLPNGGFKKTKETSENFTYTAAYDILFTELISDDKAAAAFVKGILPADIAAQVENNGSAIPPGVQGSK